MSEDAANVYRLAILEEKCAPLTNITRRICPDIFWQNGDDFEKPGNSCTVYPVQVVLLNFNKMYKTLLVQSVNSLVSLPAVETEKSRRMRDGSFEGPQ